MLLRGEGGINVIFPIGYPYWAYCQLYLVSLVGGTMLNGSGPCMNLTSTAVLFCGAMCHVRVCLHYVSVAGRSTYQKCIGFSQTLLSSWGSDSPSTSAIFLHLQKACAVPVCYNSCTCFIYNILHVSSRVCLRQNCLLRKRFSKYTTHARMYIRTNMCLY